MSAIQQKKTIIILLKVLIFITLSYLLYKQVVEHSSYKQVAETFKDGLSSKRLFMIIVLLSAMLVNWFLEITKWRSLILKIQTVKWLTAIKGVLFGITFSLFTPNRVGEFGGRVVALDDKRVPSIVATLLGSLSQIVANLVLGGLGLTLYFYFYNDTDYIPFILVFLWVILAVGLPLIYFNLDMVEGVLLKIPILKKAKEHIDIMQQYSRRELLKFLVLSASRCGVYYFQYWLCLRFFGIDISLSSAIIIIPAIFFVQTVIPSFAILGPVLGGNIALTFLEGWNGHSAGIVYATFLLWMVNLIIPASLGLLLFTQHKLFKK
ncbi:MAG: lysylphosphatidylglycerol synthase domain-containing protein [Chitinophagales bacterium]